MRAAASKLALTVYVTLGAREPRLRAAKLVARIVDPFTIPGTAFKVELAKRTIVRMLQTVSGENA